MSITAINSNYGVIPQVKSTSFKGEMSPRVADNNKKEESHLGRNLLYTTAAVVGAAIAYKHFKKPSDVVEGAKNAAEKVADDATKVAEDVAEKVSGEATKVAEDATKVTEKVVETPAAEAPKA